MSAFPRAQEGGVTQGGTHVHSLPMATPPKKSDCPSISRPQVPLAPHGGVGLWALGFLALYQGRDGNENICLRGLS